jgi:hypothetical protein
MKGDPSNLMNLSIPFDKPFLFRNTHQNDDGLAFYCTHRSGPFLQKVAKMGLHGNKLLRPIKF